MNPLLLSRPISAIQVLPQDDGATHMGLLSQLAPGTIIELCGPGFNERMAKVRVNGFYYFVFAQDIELARVAAT